MAEPVCMKCEASTWTVSGVCLLCEWRADIPLCSSCVYFYVPELLCRKRSPTIYKVKSSGWPSVNRMHSCGEHSNFAYHLDSKPTLSHLYRCRARLAKQAGKGEKP